MKGPFILLALMLIGCQSVENDEKKVSYVADIPLIPEPGPSNISILSIPIDFPVTELSKMVNNVLPSVLMDDTVDLKKGDFLIVKLVPTGEMLFNSYGNNLDVSLPMNVSVAVSKKVIGLKIKTKDPVDFAIRADLHTKLEIDKEWKLQSSCEIQKIHWMDPPEKTILGIKINLEKMVEKAINKNSNTIEDAICKVMSELVPIEQQVRKLWSLINTPHSVAKKPVEIWLTGFPEKFYANFESNIKDTLRVNVLVATKIVVSPLSGIEHQPKPMPVNAVFTAPPGLSLDVKMDIPYDLIEGVIHEKIGDTIITYQGMDLKFSSCEAGTEDNKLLISLGLTGAMDATIKSLSYPVLDSKKNLVISDISYEIVTENSLLKITDWATNTTITDYLKEKSMVPLSKVLDSLDVKIMEAFETSKVSQKMTMNLEFRSLESDTLMFTKDRILWYFDVKGRANATLNANLVQ